MRDYGVEGELEFEAVDEVPPVFQLWSKGGQR